VASGSHSPSGSAVPAASVSPAATASSVPAAGTVLAQIDDIGQTSVISNPEGAGFDIVHDYFDLSTNKDLSTLEVHDSAGNLLTTLPAGSFTGDCGAADVVTTAGRLVLTVLVTTNPAQGIKPPTYSLTMTAWTPATGAAAWTADLVPAQRDQISCPPGGDGELLNFTATLNGQWGVIEPPVQSNTLSYDAIDLATGTLYHRSDLLGVLGNDVVTGSSETADGDGPFHMVLTIPGSWPRLAAVVSSDQARYLPLAAQNSGASDFTPSEYAPTGYLWGMGPTGNGPDSAATPDGKILAVVYSDENDNTDVRGYALPSMRLLWSNATPRYHADNLAAVNDTEILVDRSENGGSQTSKLMALDPQTGAVTWTANIGGGSVCDLTSAQVLVADNDQLSTLDAGTGRQLSYQSDPVTDGEGDSTCPTVIETGLSGVGTNNNQILQLLSATKG
jgi:PQQ-like domain